MSQEPNSDNYTDPMLCRHCQAETPLLRVASFVQDVPDVAPITHTERWVLLACPRCAGVSLQKRITDNVPDENMDVPVCTVVYPGEVRPPFGLPPSIESAFIDAAMTASVSSSLAGVGFRRVLEMVCRDKNIEASNLATRIKQLVESEDPKASLAELA